MAFLFVMAPAQPMQAATYTDHAKTTGRCSWHLAKIASGALLLGVASSVTYKEVGKLLLHRRNALKNDLLEWLGAAAVASIASIASIKSGIDGLKEEWLKNQKTPDQK